MIVSVLDALIILPIIYLNHKTSQDSVPNNDAESHAQSALKSNRVSKNSKWVYEEEPDVEYEAEQLDNFQLYKQMNPNPF